jgi:hypothetical protein
MRIERHVYVIKNDMLLPKKEKDICCIIFVEGIEMHI